MRKNILLLMAFACALPASASISTFSIPYTFTRVASCGGSEQYGIDRSVDGTWSNIKPDASISAGQTVNGVLSSQEDSAHAYLYRGHWTDGSSFLIYTGVGGNSDAINTTSGNAGPGDCRTNICSTTNQVDSWSVRNNTGDYQLYWITLDGSYMCSGSQYGVNVVTGSGTGAGMILAPGTSGTLTSPPIGVGCGGVGSVQMATVANYAGMSASSQNGSSCVTPQGGPASPAGPTTSLRTPGGGGGSTGNGTGAGVTTGVQTGGGTNSPNPQYYDTNTAPITFNPTNSPGGTNATTDGTMQNGFNALYDAINRQGSAIQSQLQAVNASVQSGDVALYAISNFSGSIAANTAMSTNLLVAATNMALLHWVSETNVLTQLWQVASNSIVANTNGLKGVSNAVFSQQVVVSNLLSSTIGSNFLNTVMLSNVMAGASNASFVGASNIVMGLTNLGYLITNALAGLGTNSGSGTNVFDVASVTNNANYVRNDITNGLGNIYGAVTNLSNTNLGGYAVVRPSSIAAEFTNADAAKTVVDGLLGSTRDSATAYGDDAGSLSGVPDTGGSGGSGLTMAFMGESFNLDPDATIPGVCNYVYYLTELALIIGFYMSVAKLYKDTVNDFAKIQKGSVPNLMAEILGSGGNLLGVAAHPVICTAIITLWVSALTLIFGKLPSAGMMATAVGHVSGSVGIGGGVAWNLICRTIPVSLMFSLIATRISLQIFIGNLILFAASVQQWFIG